MSIRLTGMCSDMAWLCRNPLCLQTNHRLCLIPPSGVFLFCFFSLLFSSLLYLLLALAGSLSCLTVPLGLQIQTTISRQTGTESIKKFVCHTYTCTWHSMAYHTHTAYTSMRHHNINRQTHFYATTRRFLSMTCESMFAHVWMVCMSLHVDMYWVMNEYSAPCAHSHTFERHITRAYIQITTATHT